MNIPSARLLHLGALRIGGTDAIAFLQGQLSNDLRRLAAGEPLLAAQSSVQGRVLAVMHLLPHSSGVIAILPRELMAVTIDGLRRYVLRAKVTIEDLGEGWAVCGSFAASSLNAAGLRIPESASGCSQTGSIACAHVRGDANRWWAVGEAAELSQAGLDGPAAELAAAEQAWRRADIHAGIPQIYAATRDSFVAQMLNLDLLDGVSFSKGCYTGQEIIARTQHLGRIKRRMFGVILPPGAWRIGDGLRLADGRAGRLVEVVRLADRSEALAVLPLQPADERESASAAASTGVASPQATAVSMLRLPYALSARGTP